MLCPGHNASKALHMHVVSIDTHPPGGGAMSLPLGCSGNHLCSNAPHICQGPQMTGLGKAWFFFFWNASGVVQKVMSCMAIPFQVLWLKRPGYVCMYICTYGRTYVFTYLFCLYLLLFLSCKILQCPAWNI